MRPTGRRTRWSGQVTGTNGENAVAAYGSSQAEAWWRARVQARAVGMLAPPLLRER
jgi:hypothetical protein